MPENPIEALHSSPNWQQQLADAFTTIADLCRYLELSITDLPVSSAASTNFPIRVPLSFAACMEKGNPNDPLLRQVLPVKDELINFPGFSTDPVGDKQAVIMPGLLHKYQGRVLLINTGSCAINCRYCFRRNFPYSELQLTKQQENQVFAYIQSYQDITEVILSGGDPLLLSDARLLNIIQRLNNIVHIKRLRIHSRLPIVLPARITQRFIDTLRQSKQHLILIVHSNHPSEISTDVTKVCQLLNANGITLFNQAVLLKGINNDVDTLCKLSETLFTAGIIPYYLHQIDKAKGVGHFQVSDDEAKTLIDTVKNRLPGYLVPKLVQEVAGEKAKQWL